MTIESHRRPSPRPEFRRGLGWRPHGRSSLWRNGEFLRFWAASGVSDFGTHISLLALPLLAAVSLGATPAQMGLLAAFERFPNLFFGLFVGVIVDRVPRRMLMIRADWCRAGLLALAPLLWIADWLRIEMLFVIAFLTGALTLLYQVAYIALLPGIVSRGDLPDANGKLEASTSAARAGGPGIAGVLVGMVGAPLAVLIDAGSYVASARLLRRVNAEPQESVDTRPAGVEAARPLRMSISERWRTVEREIGEGIVEVWREPRIRAMTLASSTTEFFGFLFLAVYLLFMSRELGFGATLIGLVLAVGGVGAFMGAMAAVRLTRWLGIGPTIVWAQATFGVTGAAVFGAIAFPQHALWLLAFTKWAQWAALAVYHIGQRSVRQAMIPDALQGRVTATIRTISTGSAPLGSLLGGLLGTVFGLGATLSIGAVGMMLAPLWVVFSPLWALRVLPSVEPESPS